MFSLATQNQSRYYPPVRALKPREPSAKVRKLLAKNPTLPPGDLSHRNNLLVTLFPWKLALLRDLPRAYRNAVAVHLQGDRPSDADLLLALGHRLIGVAQVSLVTLCNQVMNDPDRRKSFSSMDDYHQFFCRKDIEGTLVKPWKNTWPIVLSGRGRDRETIVDGWHRFHTYFRRHRNAPSGVRSIPVIWYADE